MTSPKWLISRKFFQSLTITLKVDLNFKCTISTLISKGCGLFCSFKKVKCSSNSQYGNLTNSQYKLCSQSFFLIGLYPAGWDVLFLIKVPPPQQNGYFREKSLDHINDPPPKKWSFSRKKRGGTLINLL